MLTTREEHAQAPGIQFNASKTPEQVHFLLCGQCLPLVDSVASWEYFTV